MTSILNWIYSYFGTSDTKEQITDLNKTNFPKKLDNNTNLETHRYVSLEDSIQNTSFNNYSLNPASKIKKLISENNLTGLISSLTSYESYNFFSMLINSTLQDPKAELFNDIRLFITKNNAWDEFYSCMSDFLECHMYKDIAEKQISAMRHAFDTLDESKDAYESFSDIERNIADKTQPLLSKDEYRDFTPTNAYKLSFLDLASLYGRYDIKDLFSDDEMKSILFNEQHKEPITKIKTFIKNNDFEGFIKTLLSTKNEEVIYESFRVAIEANYKKPFSEMADFITKHDAWDEFIDKLVRLNESYGLSEIQIKTFLSSYKFGIDLVTKEADFFSNIEKNIMDRSQPLLTKDEYINGETNSTHGLDFFNLAILYSRNDILNLFSAEEIRDFMLKSLELDISSIDLMSFMQNQLECFSAEQYKKILTTELIDYKIGQGQTHLDILIDFFELKETVISRTNDPFYKLIKDAKNFEEIFADSSKTYVAISYDSEIWSDSLLHAARIISQNKPDVQFLLISNEIINETEGRIFEKIDAWMNPGSIDSYSSNGRNEFTQETWDKNRSVEQLYQSVLDAAKVYKFPVLGVCGGAQNAILNNNGSIQKLDGYNAPKEKHEITFQPGTLGHLLSLTKNELVSSFEKGVFPEIKYLGETYHGYAAVNGKLGSNLNLDALSEDGVPMAYSGNDEFISFNTQYHPEMHYLNYESSEESDINHQKTYLDNFVKLATLNHLNKVGEAYHPQEYLHALKEYVSGGDIGMNEIELIQDYFVKLETL